LQDKYPLFETPEDDYGRMEKMESTKATKTAIPRHDNAINGAANMERKAVLYIS